MLILIYGEDTFRSRKWLYELEKKFKEKFDPNGYNLSRFEGMVEIKEIRASIVTAPFLGQKRMVSVTGLIERSGKGEEFLQILSQVPESTILILWEQGDEKTFSKIPLFASLIRNKENKTYPFPPLKGLVLEKWARDYSKKLNINFERNALPMFVARIGSDLWQMSGELEKMAASGKTITAQMVEDSVHGTTEENIFGFIDAVTSRDSKKAMVELAREREAGIGAHHLISMIARQVRILHQAKDYAENHPGATATEIAEVFGWHPFVAKKTLSQIRSFSKDELLSYGKAIFQTDCAIKSGVYDADTALDLLVSKFFIKEKSNF